MWTGIEARWQHFSLHLYYRTQQQFCCQRSSWYFQKNVYDRGCRIFGCRLKSNKIDTCSTFPPQQSILATIILITWLLGAPVMSASVEQLSHTQYIRLNGIDTLYLLIATVSTH